MFPKAVISSYIARDSRESKLTVSLGTIVIKCLILTEIIAGLYSEINCNYIIGN